MSPSSAPPRLRLDDGGVTRDVAVYSDEGFALLSELWLKVTCERKVMYRPTWLGVPIIQYPDDVVMMQELIWNVRPDLIIETGVAHGGSAVFHASMLELLGRGRVLGIDREIRPHNRAAIERHPLARRIELLELSSLDARAVAHAAAAAGRATTTLVVLDSNHSRDHVFAELSLYGPLVTPGSYIVAMDGAQGQVWDIPSGRVEWREDNPLRAIDAFVAAHAGGWEIDPHYTRMAVTSNPRGYLRRKPI
jgi:cephalosporin hydroxylase